MKNIDQYMGEKEKKIVYVMKGNQYIKTTNFAEIHENNAEKIILLKRNFSIGSSNFAKSFNNENNQNRDDKLLHSRYLEN